jgi:hypothetical protein
MFDTFRFAADDDMDDFGYEEEHLDVQSEVGEYGPEDEDEDELTKPHHPPMPEPAHAIPSSTPSTSTPGGEAPPQKKPVKKAAKSAPAKAAPAKAVKAAPAKKAAAK